MPIAAIFGPEDLGNPARDRASPGVGAAERARALPMPQLEWTPEVERATADGQSQDQEQPSGQPRRKPSDRAFSSHGRLPQANLDRQNVPRTSPTKHQPAVRSTIVGVISPG